MPVFASFGKYAYLCKVYDKVLHKEQPPHTQTTHKSSTAATPCFGRRHVQHDPITQNLKTNL